MDMTDILAAFANESLFAASEKFLKHLGVKFSTQTEAPIPFLEFYEDYALRHGCPVLRIDTNAKNAAARAMYAKHGYIESGVVPTVFNGIPGVMLVCMEKRLGK